MWRRSAICWEEERRRVLVAQKQTLEGIGERLDDSKTLFVIINIEKFMKTSAVEDAMAK